MFKIDDRVVPKLDIWYKTGLCKVYLTYYDKDPPTFKVVKILQMTDGCKYMIKPAGLMVSPCLTLSEEDLLLVT
jgi:hypothetical protein